MADLIKIDGLAELRNDLLSLPPKLGRRGLRQSNYNGGLVLATKAEQTSAWKDRTGDLRKAIGVFRRGYSPVEARHAVGVRGKTKRYANTARNVRLHRVGKKYRVASGPSLYGRFLEYGTSRMPAHAWLRPALFSSLGSMIEEIRSTMGSFIEEYMPGAR